MITPASPQAIDAHRTQLLAEAEHSRLVARLRPKTRRDWWLLRRRRERTARGNAQLVIGMMALVARAAR